MSTEQTPGEQPQRTPEEEAAYQDGYWEAQRALDRRKGNAPIRPSRKAQKAHTTHWQYYLQGWAQTVREDRAAQGDWDTPYFRRGQS